LRKIRSRIIITILLLSPFVVWGCIDHIDKACDLDLKPLPVEAQTTLVSTEQMEPPVPLYDIPLSPELQKYTYEKCVGYDVDYIMALAIMKKESNFQSDLISQGGDCGIMQINRSNLDYLKSSLGTTDIMDPKQNIEAGIFWLSGIYKNFSDPNQILMVYNMGGSIAQALIDNGRESTGYSREVLKAMDEIREMEKGK
jgi:soluble lytic murein transglycosylase-like protein